MPAIGSDFVFKVRLHSTYGGQLFQNVFNYRQVGGAFADDAIDIANAFAANVLPAIEAITLDAVEYTQIDVDQYVSVANFIELGLSGRFGDLALSGSPTFLAAGFNFLRTTKETRQGAKRIGGIADEWIVGSGYAAAAMTPLANAAAAFEALLATSSFTHFPVIIGGLYDTDVDPPVLKPEDEFIWNLVSNVTLRPRVTTQNSRKIGRGS